MGHDDRQLGIAACLGKRIAQVVRPGRRGDHEAAEGGTHAGGAERSPGQAERREPQRGDRGEP